MTEEFHELMYNRKFARVNIHALVQFLLPLESSPATLHTRISDISEGGVLLVTSTKALNIDTLIDLSFVMPGAGGQLAVIRGKVRHTRNLEKDLYESGVEFLDLKEKDRLVIRAYVDSHPKK